MQNSTDNTIIPDSIAVRHGLDGRVQKWWNRLDRITRLASYQTVRQLEMEARQERDDEAYIEGWPDYEEKPWTAQDDENALISAASRLFNIERPYG